MGLQRVGHDLGTKQQQSILKIHKITDIKKKKKKQELQQQRNKITKTKTTIKIKVLCSIRHVGEGNGTPLQYSYLETPRGRGAW